MQGWHLVGGIQDLNFGGKSVKGLRISEKVTTKAELVAALSRTRTAEEGAGTLARWNGTNGEVLTSADFGAQSADLTLVAGKDYWINEAGDIAPYVDLRNYSTTSEIDAKIELAKRGQFNLPAVASGVNKTDADFNALIAAKSASTKFDGAIFSVKVANGGSIGGTVWATGGTYEGVYQSDGSVVWTAFPDDVVQKTTTLDTTDEDSALTGKALEGLETQVTNNTQDITNNANDISDLAGELADEVAARTRLSKWVKQQIHFAGDWQDGGVEHVVTPVQLTETGNSLTLAVAGMADGSAVVRFVTDGKAYRAAGTVAAGVLTIDNTNGQYTETKGLLISKVVEQVEGSSLFTDYYSKTEVDSLITQVLADAQQYADDNDTDTIYDDSDVVKLVGDGNKQKIKTDIQIGGGVVLPAISRLSRAITQGVSGYQNIIRFDFAVDYIGDIVGQNFVINLEGTDYTGTVASYEKNTSTGIHQIISYDLSAAYGTVINNAGFLGGSGISMVAVVGTDVAASLVTIDTVGDKNLEVTGDIVGHDAYVNTGEMSETNNNFFYTPSRAAEKEDAYVSKTFDIVSGGNYNGGAIVIPETMTDIRDLRILKPAPSNEVLCHVDNYSADGSNLTVVGSADSNFNGYRIAYYARA